ncbi:MAG: formate dehydrogenase subunit delta [Steroidobacteraceae bacterium]
MNVDHLVKMANEIGSFFAGASPAQQAPRDVATHLKRYWEPRMRQAMLAHFAQGGAGLTDLARTGVAILAAEGGAGGKAGAGSAAGSLGASKS